MNRQWQQYLQSLGAVLSGDDDRIEHFGQPTKEEMAITTGDVMIPITHTAYIHASGKDAKSFLQGQLTNDIGLIDLQHSQLSGYCNPKGRLLALFRISQHDDGYRLHLPDCLVEKTLKRLNMFVLMAKVKLEASSPETVRTGVAGQRAVEKLSAHFNTLPGAKNGVTEENRVTILRHPGRQPRFELIANRDVMQKLWQKLSPDFTPVGSGSWQRLDIDAGQPQVVAETVEMFIPQMLNLHVIDGVSFKKGCYPGQEVVARLHYRGKLKRHMRIVQFRAAHCPAAGTAIYPLDSEGEPQSVGNIVRAESISADECRALCVIANDFAIDNGLCLQRDRKTVLTLHDLPYDFPTAS